MMLYDTATVADTVQALAMTGDLAMGQPPGHSPRTAHLAARVAEADGAGPDGIATARLVALLRWSGSTANAAGFAALLGDDVAGRRAMLDRTLPAGHRLTPANALPLARVHCEVAGDIARMLALPAGVEDGLRHLFEHADGNGLPARLRGDDIPGVVRHVALAGDLEILSRAHGIDTALRLAGRLAGRKYPARLVECIVPHARGWLDASDGDAGVPPAAGGAVPLALVADVLELKLPWLAGYSRRVAGLARAAADLAGLSAAQQQCLARAALLHGVGRAAIPNRVWNHAGKLRQAELEQVRRVPYWSARMATRVPGLAGEAHIASHAYERLDGSGCYRGLADEALAPEHRILAAAAAWAALVAPRPWRAPYAPAAAAALLAAQAGRFDRHAVEAVIAAARTGPAPPQAGLPSPPLSSPLSDREADVLRRVSTGAGHAETARALRISTGAVRAHLDGIFDKLGCATRPAATLKALTLGLI